MMLYTFVVASIKQMNLLLHISPTFRLILLIFDIHAGENVASVVETCSTRLTYADQALLLLIFPHSCGPVLAARNECAIQWVQVEVSDRVGMAHKRTKDIVVVKGPIHDPD